MLGVGWTEMLVIGVVALIVIGPKELPALMHKIGKFAGTIRRMGQDFQRELNKTTGLDEVKNLRASITAPLKATTDAIRKEFNTTTASGQVQPSGVLKPADPKAESVVDEIKAAAGMTTSVVPAAAAPTAKAAMTDAVSKRMAEIEAAKTAPAGAKPARVKAAPKSAAAPAKPKATPKKATAKKAVESPAPVEAIAPARKPAAKKPAVKKAAAEATPAAAVKAPAKRKPAAKKAAAKPAPAAKA